MYEYGIDTWSASV